jgi:N-acetylmuramoyl-L-alanine amidase
MKVLALLAFLASPVAAQEFTGLARLDVAESRVTDSGDGATVTLYLSQPVPYRAFTLTKPPRLVLDFREVDWRGADAAGMLSGQRITALRFGAFRPGWSRLVADLATPLTIDAAGMVVDDLTGTALLQVVLAPVDDATFNARSGAPPGAEWDIAPADRPAVAPPDPDVTVIAIDPGHGGIDPGAVVADGTEAALMLAIAVELAEAINRQTGFRAVLTRDGDLFVPLAERMTIARAAGADALVSLHADALEQDAAIGASVYTLTPDALDSASARMAERHDRGDLLAGLDLSGADDTVATALMDLARLETAPRSARLADALVAGLTAADAVLNSRPRREAPLAVLNAADFPSVLVEVGFLTSPADLERLSNPDGRAPIIAGLVAGLQDWAAAEAALAPLNRQ